MQEYLHMLEHVHEGGRAAVLTQLRRVVTNAFTYTRDVDLWAEVREAIGTLIETA